MRKIVWRCVSLLLVLCSSSAGCGGDGCGTDGCGGNGGSEPMEIRLEVEDFITGLSKPWDIAWLPNGTVLVTQRSGQLEVYVDGTDAAAVTIPLTAGCDMRNQVGRFSLG